MQTPDLKILNKSLDQLAIIDTFTSGQFERSLWEVGRMELHASLFSRGAEALQPGNLVMIDELRVWEMTGIKKTEGNMLGLQVTGREIKGVLGQRLVIPDNKDDSHHFGWDRVPGPMEPDVAAETIMKHYVNKHAITTADPKRALPGLVLAPDLGRGMKTRWSERFRSLTETLKDIGEFTGMGYRVTADLANKQFVFEVIPERVQTEGAPNPVILSVGFNNIQAMDYQRDVSRDVTIAYAGGAGEDEDRLIQAVARNPTEADLEGYDRREAWLECGSVDEIDDLVYEAKYQLAQKEKVEFVTCEALPNATFAYLKDWDIGSVVTVQSHALGISQAQKITAVKEVYEQGRVQIIPTLGKRNKTILDEIRKSEVIS